MVSTACFKSPRHTIDKSSFSVADDFCILIFSLIKFVVVIVVVVVVCLVCCCCCHCRVVVVVVVGG